MRVISGSLKGRTIKGYDIDGTRPTMDRVKESVFGIIQSYVRDSIVLDLFSGSGNYGIEAISNGAKLVYFNDLNKKCCKVISNNIKEFGIEKQGVILNLDYQKSLNYFKDNKIKFDLVFLDPPYKDHFVNNILNFINENNLLNNNGLVICEITNKDLVNDYGTLELIKDRKYSDKYVLIYQNKK